MATRMGPQSGETMRRVNESGVEAIEAIRETILGSIARR